MISRCLSGLARLAVHENSRTAIVEDGAPEVLSQISAETTDATTLGG